MQVPKPAQLIGAILFVALVASAVYVLATVSAEASPVALTKTYSNPAWGFALKMPADFSAYPPHATPDRDATGAPTGQAIVLQNQKGDSLQIVITPSDKASPDNTITAADLEREAPDVDPSEAQSVQLPSGVTGMTFTQGVPPPAPTTADVLIFTYRGNLYVLTAPTKDRTLFEAMVETWTFI
jgi:hypothetical protein